MRCYFMRNGHIADVEPLFGLGDEEAVAKSREMFDARKLEKDYDGFEVWELARMVIQFPRVESVEMNTGNGHANGRKASK
jgi:hypothetical protein